MSSGDVRDVAAEVTGGRLETGQRRGFEDDVVAVAAVGLLHALKSVPSNRFANAPPHLRR